MKIKVTTKSGSEYLFDNENMVWTRKNDAVPDILFLEGVNGGRLGAAVEPRVGERLTFFLHDHDWVCTTEVQKIEVIDGTGN